MNDCIYSHEPGEITYDDGDDEDEDDEEGELVVVGSEVSALVKQEAWGGDDSIPRQIPQITPARFIHNMYRYLGTVPYLPRQ